MAFGQQRPWKIADPICEPLWGGQRVLVMVADGRVDITATDGADVTGYDDLRAAIVDATFADEALFDGALLPAPLRDTEGARIRVGADSVPSAADRVKHIFVGQSPMTGKREALVEIVEDLGKTPGVDTDLALTHQ